MPASSSDYFRYFAVPRPAALWGVAVTGAGRTHVAPGAPYPPARHPADRHFDWARGRVLEALQVVLITAGHGRLETRGTRPQVIAAGSAFVLFPRVWHRYRPDPATGWVESWVELRGITVEKILRARVLHPQAPVLAGALATGLEAALEAVHARTRHPQPGFDPELAAQGLAVLAACHAARQAPARQARITLAVAAGERHFAEHLAEAVDVAQLARRLGVAYSHFRKAFKAHTGYAPWQYMIRLRLSQARRILAASDATLEEVAVRVGFSSSYHLSAGFKQAYGVAPDPWRRQFLTGPAPAGSARRRAPAPDP
jgi:AraC-like DNA-binding protein